MKELDEITIKSAANRNADSFKKLYEHYSPFVWKVVFRTMNGDTDAAEQIMQDIFIKVYKVLQSFRFNSTFSTWLYRISYNMALTFIAKQKKQRQITVVFNDSIGKTDGDSTYESRDTVENILKRITPKERFLLVAREVNDIPFEELAIITGRTSGSLRTQLHRIKENLRRNFKEGDQ